MILITKGGLSRGGDNEMPENCLYDCRLRDTCIYVPRWADEETLLRIGTERSKSCPLVQVYEVPKETEQERTVMYERKDEPQSVTYNPTSVNNIWEKPTNPYVPNEQTEPTISKMEQVETMSCQECKHFHENAVMYLDQCDFCFKDCKYEPKDEPQTCEECKHYLFTDIDGYYCEHETYGQTCGFEPKDEPQTDCPKSCPSINICTKDDTDCPWK